jgi:hypothetical protein
METIRGCVAGFVLQGLPSGCNYCHAPTDRWQRILRRIRGFAGVVGERGRGTDVEAVGPFACDRIADAQAQPQTPPNADSPASRRMPAPGHALVMLRVICDHVEGFARVSGFLGRE